MPVVINCARAPCIASSLSAVIIISVTLAFTITAATARFQGVNAECIRDKDWPEKPCFDSGAPSEAELKQTWNKYYEMKGKDWMEAKKAEMDQSIKNGTFTEWIEMLLGTILPTEMSISIII